MGVKHQVTYLFIVVPRYSCNGWLGVKHQVTYLFIVVPWYSCNGWLGVKHQVTYLFIVVPGGNGDQDRFGESQNLRLYLSQSQNSSQQHSGEVLFLLIRHSIQCYITPIERLIVFHGITVGLCISVMIYQLDCIVLCHTDWTVYSVIAHQ